MGPCARRDDTAELHEDKSYGSEKYNIRAVK
jgi:hypothetical protein